MNTFIHLTLHLAGKILKPDKMRLFTQQSQLYLPPIALHGIPQYPHVHQKGSAKTLRIFIIYVFKNPKFFFFTNQEHLLPEDTCTRKKYE